MVDAYAELDFLTRSRNRVRVLRLLATGEYTAHELVESTDISKTTVDRVLDAFTERGWVVETGEEYTTTRFGDMLADDYDRFVESMDVACRLGPYRELLPVDEMDFDIRLLTEAKVTDPDRLDTLQSVDRWVQLIRGSDHVRFLANTANEQIVRVMHEQVVSHGTVHESVFTPELFEYMRRRPELCALHREMIRAGAAFYRTPEATERPWFLAVYDDLVGMGGFDESGTIRTGFESEAAPVLDWAERTFESARNDATRLTVDDFSG